MKKEIFRMLVPNNKLINDNSNNNYRSHIGKLKYLTNEAEKAILDKYEVGPKFIVPAVKEIKDYINEKGEFALILEVWKCQQKFDVQNYSMTFKPIIDVFSHNKYWKDDCWKYCCPVIFNGGDFSVWKERAFRYEKDYLPDNIDGKWWEKFQRC